jgi:uncharacterized oligopeptide transporter (OPT) family protein
MPDQMTARPPFRIIAFVMAFVCFLLAVALGIFMDDAQWLMVIFLFVAFVMLIIGATGRWPPKS